MEDIEQKIRQNIDFCLGENGHPKDKNDAIRIIVEILKGMSASQHKALASLALVDKYRDFIIKFVKVNSEIPSETIKQIKDLMER